MTSQARRKRLWEKENTDGSHVINICLYIKKPASWVYYKNLKFQIFDVAFFILLSVVRSGTFSLRVVCWNHIWKVLSGDFITDPYYFVSTYTVENLILWHSQLSEREPNSFTTGFRVGQRYPFKT